MGKGGGSAKQQVNEYNLSIHMGICAELDAITAIYIGEKPAWNGFVTQQGPIAINNPNLFGGPKKEGGVRGSAYYLPGNPTQVLPTALAQKRGLTAETSPAYRGLASVYFTGGGVNGGTAGFNWGATPYLPNVWIQGRRAPKGLDPAYAMIGNQVAASFNGYSATVGADTVTLIDGHAALVGAHSASVTVSPVDGTKTITLDGLAVVVQPFVEDDDGDGVHAGTTVTVNGVSGVLGAGGDIRVNGVVVTVSGGTVGVTFGSADGTDANPAHIIYECLTNTTWGMGATPALVDKDNHEAVGQALFHEGFGMSLQWTRESSIEQFISEILDHIQAALYVDPETGKLTLKLFRDDFESTTLPLISPDNAVLDNFQRKLWGETVNEIVVTWTNPANEQEETITQQDLGNITVQGATVSDSRNYYGIRNADLASRLAIRDVRQSSAPLASVEALLDRSQWNLKPGSVVRLAWPEYDIVNLIMRVTAIDYGKIGDPSISVTLLEDIFSLEDATFDSSPSTGFTSGAQLPTPMNHVSIITAPAYFASRFLSSADAAALTYPDTLVGILGANTNPDASFYEIVGVTTLPNGQVVSEVRSTRGLLGYSTLPAPIAEEATTLIPAFGPISPGIGPNVAGFVFIGGGTERTMEIALIESFDNAGWHLARGVLDTVPRAWPTGTPMWFYDIRSNFIDDEHHSDGESVNFKLLTVTSLGVLDPAQAPVQGAVISGRPFYPNRPAKVVIGGVAFGTADLSASAPSSVEITWANRNRTLEDTTVLRWNDANTVPEAGQTTTIKLTKPTDGSVINTFDGLTGTSYTLAASAFNGAYEADVTVTAKRGSYESLMGVKRRVRIAVDPANPNPTPVTPTTEPDPPYVPPSNPYPPYQPPVYGGGGGGCPEIATRLLLANEARDGAGVTIAAGDARPGMWVWTQHETTLEWAAFQITAVKVVQGTVLRATGLPRTTPDHRFRFRFEGDAADWTRMGEIGTPDCVAFVAKITVDDAHTYVTIEDDGEWVISHNIKQSGNEFNNVQAE